MSSLKPTEMQEPQTLYYRVAEVAEIDRQTIEELYDSFDTHERELTDNLISAFKQNELPHSTREKPLVDKDLDISLLELDELCDEAFWDIAQTTIWYVREIDELIEKGIYDHRLLRLKVKAKMLLDVVVWQALAEYAPTDAFSAEIRRGCQESMYGHYAEAIEDGLEMFQKGVDCGKTKGFLQEITYCALLSRGSTSNSITTLSSNSQDKISKVDANTYVLDEDGVLCVYGAQIKTSPYQQQDFYDPAVTPIITSFDLGNAKLVMDQDGTQKVHHHIHTAYAIHQEVNSCHYDHDASNYLNSINHMTGPASYEDASVIQRLAAVAGLIPPTEKYNEAYSPIQLPILAYHDRDKSSIFKRTRGVQNIIKE